MPDPLLQKDLSCLGPEDVLKVESIYRNATEKDVALLGPTGWSQLAQIGPVKMDVTGLILAIATFLSKHEGRLKVKSHDLTKLMINCLCKCLDSGFQVHIFMLFILLFSLVVGSSPADAHHV